MAVTRGKGGTVYVDVTIAEDGTVRSATVVSGDRTLRKACEEAAVRWRFEKVEVGSGERKVRLKFVFRPTDYVRKPVERNFNPPHTVFIFWEPEVFEVNPARR